MYRLAAPEEFALAISEFGGMDAVVSLHNIEHCDDPAAVLAAIGRALVPGGRLYLALPCEASARFPRRRGTLNFFDDTTHDVGALRVRIGGVGAQTARLTRRKREWRP